MQTVMVSRNDLLETLRANRANHREIFEAAVDSYRAKAIAELDKRLDDIVHNRTLDVIIRLPLPQDHTSDYDRVILQAQMSVNDELELSDQEFEFFVMDNWAWKQQWTSTNASYGVG